MIKFNDDKKGQVGEPIRDKDTIVNVADILGNADNYLLFNNNIEYKWPIFIQAGKIIKESITMFFSNPTLVLMQEHLS